MANWGWVDDILGMMNWLDWLEGVFRGALAGDIAGHRIALSTDPEFWQRHCASGGRVWSQNDMRALLKSYHVKTYGRGFNSSEIWIHVPRRQARWAEYLLIRAGCPVQMATVDGRNVGWANQPKHGGKMPARWDDTPRRNSSRRRAGRGGVVSGVCPDGGGKWAGMLYLRYGL